VSEWFLIFEGNMSLLSSRGDWSVIKLEDEDNAHLQNVRNYLGSGAASYLVSTQNARIQVSLSGFRHSFIHSFTHSFTVHGSLTGYKKRSHIDIEIFKTETVE
jgi:hypothetical protein